MDFLAVSRLSNAREFHRASQLITVPYHRVQHTLSSRPHSPTASPTPQRSYTRIKRTVAGNVTLHAIIIPDTHLLVNFREALRRHCGRRQRSTVHPPRGMRPSKCLTTSRQRAQARLCLVPLRPQRYPVRHLRLPPHPRTHCATVDRATVIVSTTQRTSASKRVH